MDIKEIKEKIREEMTEILELEPGELSDDKPLSEFGMDSFIAMNLISRLEYEFDITVPPSDYERFGSVNEAAAIVEELIG